MNFRQLQYAVKLAQVRSFSQLAEKLDISQPALSKQILTLEDELGIKIFDRNSIPLGLTPAGEYFITQAKELVYKEGELKRSMEKFSSGESGNLTIGISPFRSIYLMPGILKKVRDEYPGIRIVLYEESSDELRKGAVDGKYDFALVNLPVDESVLDVVPIEQDVLVLAVPNDMVTKEIRSKKELSIYDVKELPFVVVGQTQEMRLLFDKLCAEAEIVPQIAAEVVSLNTARELACAGVGVTLLPVQFMDNESAEEKVTLFKLEGRYNIRRPAIVTKRGRHITKCAEYAMSLLINQNKF